MHVVFRESRGLEETAIPRDIGQDPADLVVLSYSDSDLARVRGRLAPRPRQPAVAAARQSRRAPSSALGRHLYRAHAGAGARHPGAPDRRGILLVVWARGPAATGEGARHRAGRAAGRRPRRHAAGCVFDPAGLDAAAAQGALRHRRPCRSASRDRAARAGLGPLCGTGYRRDDRARDGLLRSGARCHCRAGVGRGQAARARDLLSLLSHRCRHRPGRCPDRRAARAGV